MIDIVQQINATHREIGDMPVADGAGRSLLLRRVYGAAIEDVWDACTDPARLGRWLGTVDGDLRVAARSSSRATPAARSCGASSRIFSRSPGFSARA